MLAAVFFFEFSLPRAIPPASSPSRRRGAELEVQEEWLGHADGKRALRAAGAQNSAEQFEESFFLEFFLSPVCFFCLFFLFGWCVFVCLDFIYADMFFLGVSCLFGVFLESFCSVFGVFLIFFVVFLLWLPVTRCF